MRVERPRAVRRIHLPSVATIAASAAAVAIAYKALDAATGPSGPRPAEHVELTAAVRVPHISPDAMMWRVDIMRTGATDAETNREVHEIATRLVERLHASDASLVIRPTDVSIRDQSDRGPFDDARYGAVTNTAKTRYLGWQRFELRATNVAAARALYRELATDRTLRVSEPRCTLENPSTALQQAQQAAWLDIRRQLTDAGLGASATPVEVRMSEGEIFEHDKEWTCESGFVVTRRLQVVYAQR
jgi:hypothetical protein